MDPFGAGYHITQSKLALGLGGLSGQGFMQRMQSPAEFVPEKHTDFIASIIGEEWGFAGLLFLIAIYALLILMMMRMASRCQNRFARLAIAGSAMTFFIYVFINLAMVTGLVPVVGIPLPLVSYGGTSMMTLMVGLGLAMSGYVHGRDAGQGANRPVLIALLTGASVRQAALGKGVDRRACRCYALQPRGPYSGPFASSRLRTLCLTLRPAGWVISSVGRAADS